MARRRKTGLTYGKWQRRRIAAAIRAIVHDSRRGRCDQAENLFSQVVGYEKSSLAKPATWGRVRGEIAKCYRRRGERID